MAHAMMHAPNMQGQQFQTQFEVTAQQMMGMCPDEFAWHAAKATLVLQQMGAAGGDSSVNSAIETQCVCKFC
eukprot:CAMPEP_0179468324 /NCGR_PEP_ID=MMETSP0799-20121207/49288_1 /TAXON_ID=46947 /ORGANISM="Geminigera cryophila, Strain CCMP2564" /LENGTH=71 /DNA_ID=CAMNT_0021274289 /DNA_START=49 /DNA_END=261 /DNA_ORIENTATION=+